MKALILILALTSLALAGGRSIMNIDIDKSNEYFISANDNTVDTLNVTGEYVDTNVDQAYTIRYSGSSLNTLQQFEIVASPVWSMYVTRSMMEKIKGKILTITVMVDMVDRPSPEAIKKIYGSRKSTARCENFTECYGDKFITVEIEDSVVWDKSKKQYIVSKKGKFTMIRYTTQANAVHNKLLKQVQF
jgi:hypothetical protein